jgi:hypothetical protein
MEEEPKPAIKGKNNIKYEYWDFYECAEKMLHKSTVFWGETGVGKSFLINTYLDAMSSLVTILHVFSSSANCDKDFPINKYTSPLFIKESLDIALIDKIMVRGRNQVMSFENANNIDNMRATTVEFILPYFRDREPSIYDKFMIAMAKIKRQERLLKRSSDCDRNERLEMARKIASMYRLIMVKTKKYIRMRQIEFDKSYKELLMPIIFCDLKPSNMIYFNDVSSDARTLNKDQKKIYNDLHTMERHCGLTIIWALHNNTYMPKEIRAQIKFHIFVSASTLISYISNNNIVGSLKKRLEDACEAILVADSEKRSRSYTVVLFDKLNDKIYYTMADAKLEQSLVGNAALYEALKNKVAQPHLDNNKLIDEIFL